MRISRPSRRPSNHLRRIVAEMGIPVPWTRHQLVDSVASRRGRPIELISVDRSLIAGGHFGLWLSRADDDVILYPGGTSDVHATHIICHEIAHMELGHDREAMGEISERAQLPRKGVPGVDTAGVVRVFGRSNYSSDQEYEAELLATLIMASHRKTAVADDARVDRILGSF